LLEVVPAALEEKPADIVWEDDPVVTCEYVDDELDYQEVEDVETVDVIPDPPSSHVRSVDEEEDDADDDVQAKGPDAENRPANYFAVVQACNARDAGKRTEDDEDDDDEILIPSSRKTGAWDVYAMIAFRCVRVRSLRPYRRFMLSDSGSVVRAERKLWKDAWEKRDALRLAKQSDAEGALDKVIYQCAWYSSRSIHKDIVAQDVLNLKHFLNLESLRKAARSRPLIRNIWNAMHRLHAELEGREDQESSEYLEALWDLFMLRVRRSGILGDMATCILKQVNAEAFGRLVDTEARKRAERTSTIRRSRAA
jgi:hypothetical protein